VNWGELRYGTVEGLCNVGVEVLGSILTGIFSIV
jgi:hypothetical protein